MPELFGNAAQKLRDIADAADAALAARTRLGRVGVSTEDLVEALSDAAKNETTSTIALARRLGDLNAKYAKRAF